MLFPYKALHGVGLPKIGSPTVATLTKYWWTRSTKRSQFGSSVREFDPKSYSYREILIGYG